MAKTKEEYGFKGTDKEFTKMVKLMATFETLGEFKEWYDYTDLFEEQGGMNRLHDYIMDIGYWTFTGSWDYDGECGLF